MKTSCVLLIAPIVLALWETASATNCKGCVALDELTFDKVINHFKAVVVKFDTAYPYGDKHEEFSKVAANLAEVNDVLVSEVGVKDYGDKDNEALGKRFGVNNKDMYPTVILFVKDEKTGKLKDFKFGASEEFKAGAIVTFIKRNSGIYIPLPGCLENFDRLAKMFVEATSPGEKGKVMAEAEKSLSNASEGDSPKAEVYVKIMRKIVKEGEGVPESELKRVNKVLTGGKLSSDKKKQMDLKINVLSSFLPTVGKDEL